MNLKPCYFNNSLANMDLAYIYFSDFSEVVRPNTDRELFGNENFCNMSIVTMFMRKLYTLLNHLNFFEKK